MAGIRGATRATCALDGVAALHQHGHELRAFARARGGELGERLAHEPTGVRGELVRRQRSARPARPASAGSRRPTSGRASGDAAVTSAAAFASCATRARSTASPAASAAVARRARRGIRPCRASIRARICSRSAGFEAAQFVGKADLEVEKAVVDGTQFDGQRHAGKLRGNCREARHAEDHRRNPSDSGNFSDFTLGAFIRRMYALSATGASTRLPSGMRIASEFRG